MEDLSLISIVVPVYKVEAYLDRCVESIVNQTYRNLEIILVDDGSPDNCPAMCDAWARKDGRIRVIHKANGGLSDARNAGMAVAVGAYLGFVDSDDWVGPEMYERLLKALEHDRSDIAACGVEMIWEDETPSSPLIQSGSFVLNREEAMRAIIEESRLKQPVWYKLYKADQVRDIAFPIGKYHEDVFWSYQAIGRAQKVSVIDYVGYFYWQRSGSIMGDGYSLKRLDALEAQEQRLRYIEIRCHGLTAKAKCSLLFSCFYQYQQAMRCLSEADCKKAFEIIARTAARNKVSYADLKAIPLKQRIWVILSRISFSKTCMLRNRLGIGV